MAWLYDLVILQRPGEIALLFLQISPEVEGIGIMRIELERRKLPMASDERILGSGEFIEEVLSGGEKRLEDTLRLKVRKVELGILASRVSRSECTDWDFVRSGSRVGKVVKARRFFCQLAVKKFGYSGEEVARYLGTTTSSVTRLANAPELPGWGVGVLCLGVDAQSYQKERIGTWFGQEAGWER